MTHVITPYFFQCCKYEPCPKKRKVLENIGFGQGYFLIRRNQNLVLETSNGPFSVPSQYSAESYSKLNRLLWAEDHFSSYLEDIKDTQKVWSNVKKRDKIRTLDNYIINLKCSFQEKQRLKSIFTLALMLHLIKHEVDLKQNLDSLDTLLNLDDTTTTQSKGPVKQESICSTFESYIT